MGSPRSVSEWDLIEKLLDTEQELSKTSLTAQYRLAAAKQPPKKSLFEFFCPCCAESANKVPENSSDTATRTPSKSK